ncbi:retrovirus-related pol polyprotein from transposon TNT 1-94 [Tanacetum coccineum]
MVRAKELFTWTPSFESIKEHDYSSEDESVQGVGSKENKYNTYEKEEGEFNNSEDEEVAETDFMEKSSQSMEHSVHVDKEISADPFGLNDLLGLKKPVEENLEPSPSLSHPGVLAMVHEDVSFNSVGGSGNNKGGSVLGVLDEMIRVGLGSKSKKEWVKELSNNNKLNFIAIQETKMEKVSHMDVKFMWGNSNYDYVFSEAAGNSGGILCIWEESFFKKDYVTISDSFVAIYGTWIPSKTKLLVVSIYAPQQPSLRRVLWEYLLILLGRWNGEAILMGDYNEVRTNVERRGSKNSIVSELRDIDKRLDQYGPIDSLIFRRQDLMSNLNDLKEMEDMDFVQKAKVRWAIEGDENSKYFHGIINKKRSNLAIRGVSFWRFASCCRWWEIDFQALASFSRMGRVVFFFIPWRSLTTIINLCLTGKTSGFERLRAPVLQILWGVVKRAHIDYAERMWEEFTQSIHTFIEDKKNLAQHTQGKKKATLIVIPSVRFTKLIIHHLQSKHKFHLSLGSPLHLPNEEPFLGYLKFSAKGTKREVFVMPIPNNLITADIQGEQYCNAYLEKVAKHQRYLADEDVSDLDSPAPKPAKATKPKATKKSKPSAPKATPVTKPAASKSQQPKSAPAKPQEKKQKLVTETSEAPSPAKQSKAGNVAKNGKSLMDVHAAHQGPLLSVVIREPESGKFQPLPEVQGKGKEKVGEEQAAQVLLNLQTPKKKSPADQYIFQRRSSAPTEPSGHDESSSLYAELGLTDSETESDEEVPGIDAGDQDEGQAGPNPGIQDEGQAGSNPGDAAVSQPQPSHVVHAGPNLEHMDVEVTDTSIQQNPEQMDEEFTTTAYPNVQENLKLPTEDQVRLEEPANSAGTLSSLQNLDKEFSFTNQFLEEKSQEDEPEKTNTESEVQSMVTVPIHQDTSSVPLMTTPVIDLTVSQPVSTTVQAPLPTSTSTVTAITTTTSLPPPPPQPQQSTTYSILIKHIGELKQHMADLVQDNLALEEILDKHGSRLYKLENLDIPYQVNKAVDEIFTYAVNWAIQAPLRDRFRDLPEADMKEILHHRMCETKSYEAHEDHKKLYEALEKSMDRDHSDQLLTDLAEARRKKKRRHDSPQTPPRSSQLPPPFPPPSTNQSDQSKSTAALSSSKTATSAEYMAWRTTDTRLKPYVSSIPEDLHMDADSAPDEQVHSSDDEDIGNDHIPTVNLKQDWWKPLPKEDRPATPEPAWSIPSPDLPVPINNWASALASTYAPPPENSLLAQTGDMAIFMDWFCKKQRITELTQKDLEGPAFEIIKVFHPNVIHLQYQMEECHKLLTDQVDDAIMRYNVSKPLPLGGQPGQVTIQADFFFNKDLEYLRYGSKGGRPALSISKMKAACYPDVGLEQMA